MGFIVTVNKTRIALTVLYNGNQIKAMMIKARRKEIIEIKGAVINLNRGVTDWCIVVNKVLHVLKKGIVQMMIILLSRSRCFVHVCLKNIFHLVCSWGWKSSLVLIEAVYQYSPMKDATPLELVAHASEWFAFKNIIESMIPDDYKI